MKKPLEDRILYEDNHLLIVNKEPSEIVQGDKTGDVCLLDDVKSYIKETYNKPGNVFVGLVHRLDRPTGGIMVFAKTSKGASRLSEQIREKTFEKQYYAIVRGEPKKKIGHLEHYLKKDEANNVLDNFKKNNGYLNSITNSKKYGIYRQNYCGCEFAKFHLK